MGDLRDNLELPVACRLHVSPNSPRVSGGDARLTGGQWAFSTNIKEGFQCADGSWAPVQETYKFDDLTMTGTRSVSNSAACNGQVGPKIVVSPFTLAFDGPLPIPPVDRYPLYCDPGGSRGAADDEQANRGVGAPASSAGW